MLKVEHPTDYLIKEGVNSEVIDPLEETEQAQQLHKLKRYHRSDSDDEREKNRELFSAIYKNKLQEVTQLLDSGVNINIIDGQNKDNTPLHYAIEKDKKGIIELLLDRGADIIIKNRSNKSSLELATESGNQEIINILTYRKINVPADGSCLFWAVTLAYLIPVKYDNKAFQKRFERLFGSIDSEELEQIQELTKSYNPFSNSVAIRNYETLRRLVTEKFRNRVVDEISSHQSKFEESITIHDFLYGKNEDYVISGTFQEKFRNEFGVEISQYNIDINKLKPDTLSEATVQEIDSELDKILDQNKVKKFKFETYVECMRNSRAWGGNHEIQAMSQVLHSNILVFSDDIKHFISYDNSNNQIQLFNNGESHYNFGLVRASILIEAIKGNKQQKAKTYLNLGIDNINYQNGEDWTALHFAAQHGDTEITQLLLGQGSNIDVKNRLNQTPLDVARVFAKHDIISILVDKSQSVSSGQQASLESETEAGRYNYSLQQHDIAHIARIKYDYTENGTNTIFNAIELQDLAQQLIEFKNKVNQENEARSLTLIINLDRLHWVTLLITHKNKQFFAYYCDSLGNPLANEVKNLFLESMIQDNQHPNIVDLHIKQQNEAYNSGIFALENADKINRNIVETGRTTLTEIVSVLELVKCDQLNQKECELERKDLTEMLRVDKNRQDFIINTLHAPKFQQLELFDAIKYRDLIRIKDSLNKGVDVNAKNENGNTPLHIAAFYDYDEVIKILLDKGANINAKNENNNTPLQVAAFNGCNKVTEVLLKEGLFDAVRSNNLIEVQDYLNRGASVNVKSDGGSTPLHVAAFNGYGKIVDVLLNSRADVNTVDKDFWTPLHYATYFGYDKIVEALLDKKTNINAENETNRTPLHYAIRNGYNTITKMLLKKGADVTVKDENGRTPLHYAAQDGQIQDLLNYIRELKTSSQHKKKQILGSVLLEKCLPSTNVERGNRRTREAKECELSWDDVDYFNEEKEESRNPNKIRINSENFVDHIKDTPESKQAQLIQLASIMPTLGNARESIEKLVKHQKIKSHLEKASKISNKLNTGLIAKNIGSDILRGEYESVGINLGLIGGGAILGEASQKVLAKGVALEVDKKLLGSSLKVASPFLARGTSAFFAYNLIQNIKEYKSGNKDTLPEIISNGMFVGVDAAEAGVEAAELLEIIEGVSEFTGPIGEAIGALIFLGTDIYHAKKQVEEIEKHVHLTEAEELTEGVRAFFGLDPSEEIEERMEVKERNNLLVENAVEFLKKNTDIIRYVFPSIIEKNLIYWKEITQNDNDYNKQKEIYCKNTAKYECQYFAIFPFRVKFDVYNVSFPFVKDSSVDLREKDRYVKLDEDLYYMLSKFNTGRDQPILSCYPGKFTNERVDFLSNNLVQRWQSIRFDYLCESAYIIRYIGGRTGDKTLFNLGEGNDTAIGAPNSPNIFLVNNGYKNYTGGNEDDTFLFQGSNITGIVNGGRGVDTLDLIGFDSKSDGYALVDQEGVFCSANDEHGALYECTHGVNIENIERIYGRRGEKDRVYIAKNLEYIDGLRGKDSEQQDYIHVTTKSNKNPKIVLRGDTRVLCYVSNTTVDSINYIIPRGEYGQAFVHLRFQESIQYRFNFEYSLSNLRDINIKKDHVTYNLFDQQREFNVTILDSYLGLKKKDYRAFPINASYIFQDNTEIKILNRSNFYAQQNSNKTVEEIISDYPAVANRLNMTLFIKLANNETIMVGHGAHEVMHNNPLYKSHLLGNGGENVYVITSAFNNTEKFPIPEVTLYGLNMGNFTDTLDLREVVQQSKIECPDSQVLPQVNKDNNDLIIKLYSNHYFSSGSCINLSSEFLISSVRLKGALVDSWYEKLDIILNNAPMKIKDNGKFWKLESLPLTFNRDKEIIVITPDDVEKDTELVTPREAGNYVFARSRNDLIITNAFDQGKSERCTISLKDFYQNTKMQTLSIKFADKEITLKDHQEQISIARNIDVMKKEHKDQIYNDVFNNTRSKNISLEVNETTTHEIRHKHRHEHSRHKHQNTIEHQRRRRAINTKAIRSSNASDDLEFFAAQNNAIFVMGNDGISSAARTPSLISDLFAWIKSSIGGLFNSRAALPENNTTQSSISQVDAQVGVNDTIILLDLLIRKVTGKKHISTEGQSMSLLEAQGYALNITTKFEQVLNETAFKSGISATNLNFNPVAVQSTIVEKIISGKFSEIPTTLCLSAKESCPEFKQTNKFLHCLGVHLEKILAEKETILLLNKQKVSSHSKSLGQLTSRIPEKVTAAELSKEDKPDTFLNSASITRSIGNVLGL